MANLVKSLRGWLDVVSSRLTAMTFVVESLLRLAAGVHWRPAPADPTPFEALLTAYLAMQKSLGAGQSVVPAAVLSLVRQQLCYLQDQLPESQLERLSVLNGRFRRLGGDSRNQYFVYLAPEQTM